MKTALGILGIACFAIGTVAGLMNWYLVTYYLETVEWEGVMVTVDTISWAVNVLAFGLGGILVGSASVMPSQPDYELMD